MITFERVAAILLAVFIVIEAGAAEVYRWIDDKGVTNVSDVVPDQYRKVAERVELPAEPDEATRRDAAARSAAIASEAARRPASASRPVPGAARPRGRGPSGIVPGRSASDDCATLQRRYKESQDCFGSQPRTITGAINGARSPNCRVVVDPSPRCGLPNRGEAPAARSP